MIVDDSNLIVSRIINMLEADPVFGPIQSAGSYAAALCLLEAHLPDLLVLDINLPDKNGVELLRYVRSHYPSVKVVMLSNQSGDYYRARCLQLGAASFIDKSTEFEQLPGILIILAQQ